MKHKKYDSGYSYEDFYVGQQVQIHISTRMFNSPYYITPIQNSIYGRSLREGVIGTIGKVVALFDYDIKTSYSRRQYTKKIQVECLIKYKYRETVDLRKFYFEPKCLIPYKELMLDKMRVAAEKYRTENPNHDS